MGTNRNTTARTLHDLGVAAWFGGSLMGAVGLNGAAADVRDPIETTKVSQAGWGRWTPVNLAAIAAHLAGGAVMTWGNKGRLTSQKGVMATTIAKTALTAGALGVTAYSRALGEKVMRAGDVPTEGGTAPHFGTPPEVAQAQKQLQQLQWAVPALTGSMIVLSAYMGEQQRTSQALKGVFGRSLGQLGKSVAAGVVVGQAAGKAWTQRQARSLPLGSVARSGRNGQRGDSARWATRGLATRTTTKAHAGRH